MNFLYPLGLLGLIGVPILIVIYIIKNKYTEQVTSSTYLWTLSERFLKKKLPINKLAGLIALILQILAVVFLSLVIAHPQLIVRGGARDYCFVLDASGSMQFSEGGGTRFDTAKEQIASAISSAKNGSAYTLVVAGGDTEVVYEDLTDRDTALSLLRSVQGTFASPEFTGAEAVAQRYFDANPSVLVHLYTDRATISENVNVHRVGTPTVNYALEEVEHEIGDLGYLIVRGTIASYEDNAKLTVQVRFDDDREAEETEEQIALRTQTFSVKAGEKASFEFRLPERAEFSKFRVVIPETDALPQDNERTVYNLEYENSYATLIVSDTPFFMKSLLTAVGNARIDTVSPKKYDDATGYDLYVFESYSPATLPSDGAVWFINPAGAVPKSGFTVQNEITLAAPLALTYQKSTKSLYKTLYADLGDSMFHTAQYMQCVCRNFDVLLRCDGNPVVFVGNNDYGNREIVFAFDYHMSDVTMYPDFVTLGRNLLTYAFPTVVETASFACGDVMTVGTPPNCRSVRLDTPSGRICYLDTANALNDIRLTEVGTYRITATTGENVRTFDVYSYVPSEESAPRAEGRFVVSGTAENEGRNGIFDEIWILFLVLSLLFAADWVVYCYEQYQLR